VAGACATEKPGLIVYSLRITEHTHGTDNVLALANLAMLGGNVGKPGKGVMPMRGQNNVQDACDMGCAPWSWTRPQGKRRIGRRLCRKRHAGPCISRKSESMATEPRAADALRECADDPVR